MDTATSNTGGGSAFASDSSTNLATVIKGLKKFDGKDPAEFKTWMKKFCVVLGVTRKDILPLLKKQRKPDPADTAAFDSYTRANEDLYAILFLLVELPAALSIQKHEDDTGISGDGQAAFEELCNNYDRVTDEVIRAKMEELENNPMNPGENPDDYFNQKHLLRTQLDKMGEPISDRRFKHICVQGFSDEYKDVKLMVFRDPTFNVLDMQSTMRNIFLDEQSRKGWKGRIAGRGFAMATTASDIICHGCYEPGHIRRNCPKIKNRAKKKTKPAGATKWCSKHNTTSHSDEECYQQGGKRPGDTKDSIRPLRVRVYQRQHHRDSHGLRRRHSHHGRRPAARGPEEEGAHGSIRDDQHGRGKADPRDRRAAGLRARNPGHFTGALREHTSGAVRNARGQPSEHSWIRSGNLHESTSGPNPRIHGQENLPVDDGKHPLPGPVHAIRPLLRCPTTFQGLQQPGAGEHDSSQARSSIPSG